VERYEALVDAEDSRIARERLADLDAGRTHTVSTTFDTTRRPGRNSASSTGRWRVASRVRSTSCAVIRGPGAPDR
jgi:hypothetical protein